MTDNTQPIANLTVSYDGRTYDLGWGFAEGDKPLDVSHTTEGAVQIKTEGDLVISGKPRQLGMFAEGMKIEGIF